MSENMANKNSEDAPERMLIEMSEYMLDKNI